MDKDLNVTVVGAGISGAACASALRRAGVTVRILERGRAPGGRMASPELHGRRVDLGAAYFTVKDPQFSAVVDGWRAAGLARPWTDTFNSAVGRKSGPMRWAAPGGLRTLVRDLIGRQPVEYATTVTELPTDADAVVLAMPDPQAARLLGDPPNDVGWEPVIAVAAGWDERGWAFADAAFCDHPDVTFVADDGARRGDGAAVLVAHSSPDLARRHYDEPPAATPAVLAAVTDLFGVGRPEWTHAHRWGIAKPSATHGEEPFRLGVDLVGICNDAYCPQGSPRVESAWLSGHRLGVELARRLLA